MISSNKYHDYLGYYRNNTGESAPLKQRNPHFRNKKRF